MRDYGSFSGVNAWNGLFICTDDIVDHRNSWCQGVLDICVVSTLQILVLLIYIISGIMVLDDSYAGCMLLVCQTESTYDVVVQSQS